MPKPGVSSPEELKAFVAAAGDSLLVVDLRNPNTVVEAGDAVTFAYAPLPKPDYRPHAVNLTFDRETATMPLPNVPKDTPIITHCGAGGRGQMGKEFLVKHGFTNVLNGGGPEEKECWDAFGQI